ncbi:MAG: alpha/beta hydrolase fold domain-containing protein, partial [Myxococcales bacterium]|nr:alpha/beta hydrolase fold domain-containing protein [Myxococcales bacterium]
GGGLTVATLVALRRRGGPLPAAAVLLSPWLDLTKTNLDENQPSDYVARDADNADARSYASALPLDDPRVSPLHADLAGLPPLYVLAGGAETLRSDSERLARRADATGVPCTLDIEPGEVHVFPYFDVVNPRAVAAFRRIGTWVREQLGRAGSVQAA